MRAVVHILFLGFISIEVLLATRSHETIAGVGGKVFVLDEVGFFFCFFVLSWFGFGFWICGGNGKMDTREDEHVTVTV